MQRLLNTNENLNLKEIHIDTLIIIRSMIQSSQAKLSLYLIGT